MSTPTPPASAPAVGHKPAAGEGRALSRLRDCDPATAHDLRALDDAGIRYEIVDTSPAATVLRINHEALRDLGRIISDSAEGARGRRNVVRTDGPMPVWPGKSRRTA